MKEFTINEIESLTYEEAVRMAEEKITIKQHECFLVDFGDYFGYSILVFKNQKHVYHANDYELHNKHIMKEKGKDGLREYYILEMNNKLFTDGELTESIKTYGEYQSKDHFLRNYWIMRYDYVSIFAISKEDCEAVEDGKKTHPYYNPISFCYVADEKIVEDSIRYREHLQAEFEKLKADNEVFRKMVRYELSNYEAAITCSYNEALNALGMTFNNLPSDRQKIVKEELNRQIELYN